MPEDAQYFNQQSGLYEYPSAAGILKSKVPRTAEEILRRVDSLTAKPQPDPNMPGPGGTGSPTVDAARSIGKIVIDIGLPAAGAALGGGAPTLAARAVTSAIGGVSGLTLSKFAGEGRAPTTPEILLEATTAGLGEAMSSAIIKNASESEQIGGALRRVAGVGDPATRVYPNRRVLGHDVPERVSVIGAESAVSASRTRLGQDLLAATPHIAEDITRREAGMYRSMARAADAEGVRIPIPMQAQRAARAVLEDLGDPADHVDVQTVRRLRDTLQRIANFGQSRGPTAFSGVGVRPQPTMNVRRYQELMREVRDLGPAYKDRMMPGNFEDGVMVGLNRSMSEGLESAVRGTRAEPMLAEAKRFHQNVKVPFRNNIVDALKSNEQKYTSVMDMVVGADNPTNLNIFMRHLPPETQQSLRQSWLNHRVIQPAVDPATQLFDPTVAQKELLKLSAETRNALFGGQSRDVESIMQRLAEEVKRRTGFLNKTRESMYVAGKAGGIPISVGMFALAQGDFSRALPALLAGGASVGALSYIFSSRRLARYVARGLESPQGSRLARRYGQLAIHAFPGEFLQTIAQPDSPRPQPIARPSPSVP